MLEIDSAYVLGWGNKQKVWIAVDLGTGQPEQIDFVDEHVPQNVR